MTLFVDIIVKKIMCINLNGHNQAQNYKPNKNKKDEGRAFSLTLSSETYSFIAFLGWQLRTGYLDLSSSVRRRL
jgi:hypothetical protein